MTGDREAYGDVRKREGRFVGTGDQRRLVPSADALGRFGAAFLASELNKDRSGRHGSEVA